MSLLAIAPMSQAGTPRGTSVKVRAIAQTPDGYLWLGTPAGLFRFDGISFTAWQPEAGQNLFSDFVCALLCRQGHLSQLFKQSRQITETFSSAFC